MIVRAFPLLPPVYLVDEEEGKGADFWLPLVSVETASLLPSSPLGASNDNLLSGIRRGQGELMKEK